MVSAEPARLVSQTGGELGHLWRPRNFHTICTANNLKGFPQTADWQFSPPTLGSGPRATQSLPNKIAYLKG